MEIKTKSYAKFIQALASKWVCRQPEDSLLSFSNAVGMPDTAKAELVRDYAEHYKSYARQFYQEGLTAEHLIRHFLDTALTSLKETEPSVPHIPAPESTSRVIRLLLGKYTQARGRKTIAWLVRDIGLNTREIDTLQQDWINWRSLVLSVDNGTTATYCMKYLTSLQSGADKETIMQLTLAHERRFIEYLAQAHEASLSPELRQFRQQGVEAVQHTQAKEMNDGHAD